MQKAVSHAQASLHGTAAPHHRYAGGRLARGDAHASTDRSTDGSLIAVALLNRWALTRVAGLTLIRGMVLVRALI